MDWIHLRWVLLYLSPVIPLTFAWRISMSSQYARKLMNLVPQVAATISLIWISIALVNQGVLGPAYSNLRGGIILGNLILVSVACLFSFISVFFRGDGWQRSWTGLACLMLFADWLLTAAANAAV
jgi:hypothetical protein